MKKILAACLLLAVLPLFAKPIPSSGPERKAAISKIHGRIALVQLGLEDYKVAVVPFGCEDLRVCLTEAGHGVGCWKVVPSGCENFKIAIVPFGCEDFRISFVEFGCQGIN